MVGVFLRRWIVYATRKSNIERVRNATDILIEGSRGARNERMATTTVDEARKALAEMQGDALFCLDDGERIYEITQVEMIPVVADGNTSRKMAAR